MDICTCMYVCMYVCMCSCDASQLWKMYEIKQNSYNEFQQSNSAAPVASTCLHSNQRYNDVTSVKPNVSLGL